MKLLLIRHAPAENALAWATAGRDDAERPLTEGGRQRMARIASVLARLEPDLDYILSSPLRRAVETAQILSSALPGEARIELAPELAPGGDPWARMEELVASPPPSQLVAMVGHAPDLPLLAGRLLSGVSRAALELKKGGAALFELGDRLDPHRTQLLWAIPPGILRRVGS